MPHVHLEMSTRVFGNLSSLGWVVLKGFTPEKLNEDDNGNYHQCMNHLLGKTSQ